MKTKTFRFTAFLLILLTVSGAMTAQGNQTKEKAPKATAKTRKADKTQKTSGPSKGDIQLFNGKDLSNWVFFLKDQAVDPATVFTVKDNVIHIKGDPFGYMRTKESYSDYTLHVEWRYPQEATNSGVFVHGQEPDAIWLKCIECQLKAGSAGDFVLMNGAEMKEQTDKSVKVKKKLAESNEKPVGEWNTMEVICKANTIDVSVNGVVQNKGTGLNITSGSICLQSEGKDIEFRNVWLTKLKK